MDTLQIYNLLRQIFKEIDMQVDVLQSAILSDTVTADHLLSGVWTNAFEVWIVKFRILVDLTDSAIDITLQNYGWTNEKLLEWGINRAELQSKTIERDQLKARDFWRTDTKNGVLNPITAAGTVRTSMNAVRNWVASNYDLLVGSSGFVIDPQGNKSWVAIPATDLTALNSLLTQLKTDCAVLLPA